MTVELRSLICGRGRALGNRLFRRRFKDHMVCHCLLLRAADRCILIDSGLSQSDLQAPRKLGPFAWGLGLQRAPELAAVAQLRELGIAAGEVTDIVLTHLDIDHARGCIDFPEATVHVHRAEYDAAHNPRGLGERLRYRRDGWDSWRWQLHGNNAESRPDIDATEVVVDDPNYQVQLVPLFGHTRGHCGVYLRANTPCRSGDQHSGPIEVLHVGDTYYDRSECSLPSSFWFERFRSSVHVSPRTAQSSRESLLRWSERYPMATLICSHDPEDFARATQIWGGAIPNPE